MLPVERFSGLLIGQPATLMDALISRACNDGRINHFAAHKVVSSYRIHILKTRGKLIMANAHPFSTNP